MSDLFLASVYLGEVRANAEPYSDVKLDHDIVVSGRDDLVGGKLCLPIFQNNKYVILM